MSELRRIIPVGFVFGLVFVLIAHFSGYHLMTGWMILVLPFITALLCALGVVVGEVVSAVLEKAGLAGAKLKHILSFFAAAAINSLLVMGVLGYFGITVFQREVAFGLVLGLGGGGVYGLYLYVTDRMKERVAFLEALAENNQRLQDASRKLAIAEERNRMGRELHDSISQGLHALVYTIHSLRNQLADPPDRVSTLIDHLEATANSTLDELRAMIEELRPSLLAEQGLPTALRMTCDLFAGRNDLPLQFECDTVEDLSPELEMTVYRVAQEALANIERHAAAGHVAVKLTSVSGRLTLIIRDDGAGFDSHISFRGNGLRNMRQRVEESGGLLQLISKPGLGTTLTAEFPTKG